MRTDGHDEANGRVSQFFANAPKKGRKLMWFTRYMITFVRFRVQPVSTVNFTLKMEYAAFVISAILYVVTPDTEFVCNIFLLLIRLIVTLVD